MILFSFFFLRRFVNIWNCYEILHFYCWPMFGVHFSFSLANNISGNTTPHTNRSKSKNDYFEFGKWNCKHHFGHGNQLRRNGNRNTIAQWKYDSDAVCMSQWLQQRPSLSVTAAREVSCVDCDFALSPSLPLPGSLFLLVRVMNASRNSSLHDQLHIIRHTKRCCASFCRYFTSCVRRLCAHFTFSSSSFVFISQKHTQVITAWSFRTAAEPNSVRKKTTG